MKIPGVCHWEKSFHYINPRVQDNEVPAADRAVDQDCQGPARGAAEAQELPPPR